MPTPRHGSDRDRRTPGPPARPATNRAPVVVVAALTAPAVAQAPPPSPQSSAEQTPVVRNGTPVTTIDRVADFYAAYIDAVYDEGSGSSLATEGDLQ